MIQIILQILLLIANSVSLVVFGIDKLQSKRRGYRIPETRLLLIAFFGPFGALVGMLLFRHKTRKIKFVLVPIFAVLQVAAFIILIPSVMSPIFFDLESSNLISSV
jgi:uncharacterized membrane protein YsdA (DUF1294 family)